MTKSGARRPGTHIPALGRERFRLGHSRGRPFGGLTALSEVEGLCHMLSGYLYGPYFRNAKPSSWA